MSARRAELIETSRTSTTDTIEQKAIDNLPINGRNYINFALTDSQVLRDNAPSIGAAPTSGLNISGQRARSNLVNVDGANAIDNSTNGVRSTVSQEAVQEFQIITNSYAAEYGQAAGGVINIITRSGSNEFHGDVYGFLRNRYIQATNPFSNVSQPAYTRVQAGTAFGGPIKKDKTYYYFAYEVTRRHETGFASIGQDNFGLVPFDATNIFAPGLAPPGTFNIQVTPQQAAFLSSTGIAAGTFAAVRVSGGRFIRHRVEWILSAIVWIAGALGAIPVPTNGTSPLTQFPSSCNPGNTLCNGLPASFQTLNAQVGNFPVFEGTSLYSLRIDHNVTSNNRIMLRANVSPSTVTGIEVNWRRSDLRAERILENLAADLSRRFRSVPGHVDYRQQQGERIPFPVCAAGIVLLLCERAGRFGSGREYSWLRVLWPRTLFLHSTRRAAVPVHRQLFPHSRTARHEVWRGLQLHSNHGDVHCELWRSL